MLEYGAAIMHADALGVAPLYMRPCDKGSTECVQLLLNAGTAVDHVDRVRRTPPLSACIKGHVECVRVLLSAAAPQLTIWTAQATGSN